MNDGCGDVWEYYDRSDHAIPLPCMEGERKKERMKERRNCTFPAIPSILDRICRFVWNELKTNFSNSRATQLYGTTSRNSGANWLGELLSIGGMESAIMKLLNKAPNHQTITQLQQLPGIFIWWWWWWLLTRSPRGVAKTRSQCIVAKCYGMGCFN